MLMAGLAQNGVEGQAGGNVPDHPIVVPEPQKVIPMRCSRALAAGGIDTYGYVCV